MASRTEAKRPQTIDGKTGKPDPTPTASQIPLSTALDVRRELAKVYREARGGTLDRAEATKLVYILDAIRKAIELEDIERRLADLESTRSKALA